MTGTGRLFRNQCHVQSVQKYTRPLSPEVICLISYFSSTTLTNCFITTLLRQYQVPQHHWLLQTNCGGGDYKYSSGLSDILLTLLTPKITVPQDAMPPRSLVDSYWRFGVTCYPIFRTFWASIKCGINIKSGNVVSQFPTRSSQTFNDVKDNAASYRRRRNLHRRLLTEHLALQPDILQEPYSPHAYQTPK
jgi:hypothetical protein